MVFTPGATPPDLTTSARARLDALLGGAATWTALHWRDTVASTNDDVVARIRLGEPVGTIVAADRQTAGRGRRGRVWEDRAGAGLLLSAAAPMPARDATLVPLATGLAIADAVARGGGAPRLKWPNDVLLAGRKTAGILVEAHHLRPVAPDVVVVGMGTNVDWRGIDRGPGAHWTSLAEARGADVDRWDLAADLLYALDTWLRAVDDAPGGVRGAYRERCATIGADVRVTLPDRVVTGRAVDVDAAGGLVVDTPGGRIVVVAGDVEHVRSR